MKENESAALSFSGNLKSVNPQDVDFVVKTGFGHGCDSTGELGTNNCLAAILDFELLKKKGFVSVNTDHDSFVKDITGKDYHKTTHSIDNVFSIDASLTGKESTPFHANLAITTKNSMTNEDTFEYGLKLLVNKMFDLSLNPQAKANIKDYILEDVKNNINGLLVNGKVNFPTDTNSLKRLFSEYGTHLITKAFYGSKYEFYMMREQNDWESDITTQVEMELNLKFPAGKDKDILGIDTKNNFTEKDTECHEHGRTITEERKIGGNTSLGELTAWMESCSYDDPSSMAMIGYVYSPGNTNVDTGLIPLWELVEDERRKDEMKKAFDIYVKERAYPIVPYKRVIADVIGRHFEKGDAPAYYYEKDETGKNPVVRKYYKLDENIFSHVTGSKHGKFYFYYAFGHSNEEGLLGIQFVDKNKIPSDWIGRGNHANEGVVGCLADNIVAIQKAPIKNGKISVDESKLITGFGVKLNKKTYRTSKGSNANFPWEVNGTYWYSAGLIHDDVQCVTTKKELEDF